MRKLIVLTVVIAVVVLGQRTDAQQSLTDSLFARYLEALRIDAAIPGMSGLVLQDGNVVWERNFGLQEIESATPPRADTPYLLGGLSQIFGATLLLKECVDEQARELAEPLTNWVDYDDPGATLAHLLAHVQPNGAYRYDGGRFSMLTPVIEECAGQSYPRALAEEIFSQLPLVHSVPGTALAEPTAEDFDIFEPATLTRYADVLSRLATPYRVDTAGRPSRSEVPRQRANAFSGVVSSAYDLAIFDRALDGTRFLEPETQIRAWTQAASHLPTGLGWYVQNYNGHAVVWQFGIVPGAYSSLIVKVPNRQLTFILLANSDGLSAPFALENGDVTASLFARVFLRLYVP